MPEFSNAAQAEEFSDVLKTGLDLVFRDDLPKHPKLYNDWLPTSSAKEYKEDGIVTAGLGPMPSKEVGGTITTDKPKLSDQKVFTLRAWALAVVMEYELVRWDLYGVFDDMTREMAKSAIDRCNIQAYSILNNFFSTSDAVYTVYNGEALGSTAHALLGGGTTTNRDASDSALSYTSLQEARNDFLTAKNERGMFVVLMPAKLIVHPDQEWYAQTLLKSTLRPGTADNDANVLPDFSVHGLSPYLTSTTAWFLTAAKSTLKSRMSVRFRMGDNPKTRSDFDHSTWNTVRTMYMSNRVEVLHYQGLWGSEGDGSI